MNQNSPFHSYIETQQDRLMFPAPATLLPLDPLHPDHLPYGLEHTSYSTNLDRRMRLESHVNSFEDLARGVFPKLPAGPDTTFHVPETVGKEEPFGCVFYYETEYPSPPGPPTTDLSSFSETDRSPSPPRNIDNYLFSSVQQAPFIHHSISDFDAFGSVAPREIEHYPEPYPEPDCPGDEVAQIFSPCPNSYHPISAELVDHDMNDDVDADGDDDDNNNAPYNSKLETKLNRATSMPKTKSSARPQRKKTTKPTSPHMRKRGGPHNPGNKSKGKPAAKNGDAADRVFFCSFKQYGCQSTFNSKNEWKRHVASQHLKLGFWRCDLPGCSSDDKVPNDFNRKDLFTQHLRRMHNPGHSKSRSNNVSLQGDEFEKTLPDHHNRCWQRQRSPPPQTQCAQCQLFFTSWEERMEHMGKHYESGSFGGEPEDPSLLDWALREGILCRDASPKGFVLTSLLRTRGRK